MMTADTIIVTMNPPPMNVDMSCSLTPKKRSIPMMPVSTMVKNMIHGVPTMTIILPGW